MTVKITRAEFEAAIKLRDSHGIDSAWKFLESEQREKCGRAKTTTCNQTGNDCCRNKTPDAS